MSAPRLAFALSILATLAIASAAPAVSDEFDAPQLGPAWHWQGTARTEWASLAAKPGSLRLFAWSANSLFDAPNLLLQDFPVGEFSVTARLDARGLDQSSAGASAGLLVLGRDCASIGLTRTAAGLRVEQVVHRPGARPDFESIVAAGPTLSGSAAVVLRVKVDSGAQCQFAYSLDGQAFTDLGGKFPAAGRDAGGAQVGLFARSAPIAGAPEFGHVEFDWFRVTR